MMTQLRGSQNYIWSLADVLGQGATGAVYKARNKRTGELYAVKTFNELSHMRPSIVQDREFDVLKKLDHENIVRLLAVETETTSKKEILVMELCSGGSLFNMLDDPINAYGVEEKEFLLIMNDVASGMAHLYNQGIVHRDIKPGNIMRYISEDGRSIYKLIDFGAARELQAEEQFMSLYGTEEYLFPDMYERAVLRRHSGKQFSATVDLWSVGVTFYHVATGQLPFRPYGGRKNKETMFIITTEKAPGVISGVQSTDNGEIVWSKQLPSTCRFSLGLKRLLTPLLAGLLECDASRMIDFTAFFAAVKSIVNKVIIHTFSVKTCSDLSLYIDSNERLAQFQELIAEETEIAANEQRLLFENHDLEKSVKPLMHVKQYPMTSSTNPVYLYCSAALCEGTAQQIISYLPIASFMNTNGTVDADLLAAKNSLAVAYQASKAISHLLLVQHLVSKAAKMYLLVLTREVEHIRDIVTEFVSLSLEQKKRFEALIGHQGVLESLGIEGPRAANGVDINSKKIRPTRDTKICEEILTIKVEIDKLSDRIQSEGPLEGRAPKETNEPTPGMSAVDWVQRYGCLEEDRCKAKAETIVNAIKSTYADFQRDKSMKKLSFNEEQIHKFDRHKLKINFAKLMSLVQDHCLPNTQKILNNFYAWFNKIREMHNEVDRFRSAMLSVGEKQTTLSAQLDQLQLESFSRNTQPRSPVAGDAQLSPGPCSKPQVLPKPPAARLTSASNKPSNGPVANNEAMSVTANLSPDLLSELQKRLIRNSTEVSTIERFALENTRLLQALILQKESTLNLSSPFSDTVEPTTLTNP